MVEFDVFGYEEIKGRRYSVACECKHWRSAVPQSVIHSFRTVVSDIGANVGYIISSAGFQSGAFRAAERTNIKLLTWEQFQAEFEETWYVNFLSPQVAEELDPLLTYSEPLLPAWFDQLQETDRQQYLELKDEFDEFGWLMMSFTPYVRMLHDVPFPQLPVIDRIPAESRLLSTVPEAILTAPAYREFCEFAVDFGRDIISRFREIRATVVQEESVHE